MRRNVRLAALSGRWRRRQEGQTLVLVGLVLVLLVPLLLMAVEIGVRIYQRSQIENALQQAARSTIQTFDYASFAENKQKLAGDQQLSQLAQKLFAINLRDVGGLAEKPELVAKAAIWKVLEHGETCGGTVKATEQQPVLCANVSVKLTGLTGLGSWTVTIQTAATLDQIQ